MRNWKRTGLLVLLIGLVALGALAAQGRLGNRDQTCTNAGTKACSMQTSGQQVQQTAPARQQLCGTTCAGGACGVRQMRCGR